MIKNSNVYSTEWFDVQRFLDRPSFDIKRRDLLARVSVALRQFVEINSFSHSVLAQLLLYGDKEVKSNVKRSILELTSLTKRVDLVRLD